MATKLSTYETALADRLTGLDRVDSLGRFDRDGGWVGGNRPIGQAALDELYERNWLIYALQLDPASGPSAVGVAHVERWCAHAEGKIKDTGLCDAIREVFNDLVVPLEVTQAEISDRVRRDVADAAARLTKIEDRIAAVFPGEEQDVPDPLTFEPAGDLLEMIGRASVSAGVWTDSQVNTALVLLAENCRLLTLEAMIVERQAYLNALK